MRTPAACDYCQLLVLSVFHFSHFSGVLFPVDQWCWVCLHVLTGHFICLLSCPKICSYFKLGFLSSYWILRFFLFHGYKPFVRYVYHKYFPQHIDCLSIIVRENFEEQQFLFLMNSFSSFFFFLFIVHAFCVLLGNLCLVQAGKDFLKLKFLENLLFQFLHLGLMIHFKLISVYGMRYESKSFFPPLIQVSSFFTIICWKDVSFPQ